MEIVVEPDFVGVDRSSTAGRAPAGGQPGGWEVHKAAEQALQTLAGAAPSSRRMYSVVLERTGGAWQRASFALAGETDAGGRRRGPPCVRGGTSIGQPIEAGGRRQDDPARIDLVISPQGIRLTGWRGSEERAATGPPRAEAATDAAVDWLTDWLQTIQGEHPLIYTAEFERASGAWSMQRFRKLAEVRPTPKSHPTPADPWLGSTRAS